MFQHFLGATLLQHFSVDAATMVLKTKKSLPHYFCHKKATKRLFVLRTLKRVGLATNNLMLVYCSIVRSIATMVLKIKKPLPHCFCHKKATKRLFVLRTLKRVGLATNDLVLVYCSIVRSIVEYASPVWAAIPLYLDELIESVQRKALKIIFGRVDYTEALVLAGLESLSDRRVGACKRFMATARQMSPLKNIIPSPAAIESHYSIRVQLPRRQHGHTKRINDFVTYKFQ